MFMRHVLLLPLLLSAAAALSAPAPASIPLSVPAAVSAPELVLPWYNGVFIGIGTDIACLSDPPIVETRVSGYTGYSLLPPNYTPAVGEVFYTHLVLAHPGNPCAGSAVGIELLLPAGVQPATSNANPAFCFAVLGTSNTLINLDNDPNYGCPQTFPQGLEGLAVRALRGGIGGGAWGMHRGFWLELLIPLRSTVPQAGNNLIRWRVNPDIGVVGYPQVPLLVNNDVIFRDSMEGHVLMLDVCTVTPTPNGC
ncbi:MAG: hypothetical protein KF903_05060 [Dokdonella sp.]|uniref:hypothetical protein n=1 Tax=Dokdonella sp. TaxID=2291710 RepID=UPI0025B9CAC0|nr:hypothetical protein [Dokdonella sp.]MBX3700352.1 hypothetical protein [Dokdonella sp.]MCW5578462.1 hypothetical protein [Dokdonella sp.]